MKKAVVELAQEKGASTWLTVLPVDEHGFALHKSAIRDALALRYGWRPQGMPSVCIRGKQNSVSHALSCARGGYVIFMYGSNNHYLYIPIYSSVVFLFYVCQCVSLILMLCLLIPQREK